MSRAFSIIQNLSLDVTAGAVISSLLVCKYFAVEATLEMMLGLGIAIWLIYTIDHLRDATRSADHSANPRHAFHRRHRVAIQVCALLVFAIGLVNAFRLPLITIKAGLVLATLSGLYFVYLKFSLRQQFKELFAAIIYTAGIFTAPLSLVTQWQWSHLLLFLLFFLLVAANLVLFPLYEMEIDSRDKITSIALKAGRQKAARMIWLLLGSHMMLVVISAMYFPQFAGLEYVFTAMNMVLMMLLVWPEKFRNGQLYRWLGDGIFFIPLLALL